LLISQNFKRGHVPRLRPLWSRLSSQETSLMWPTCVQNLTVVASREVTIITLSGTVCRP